MKPPYTADRSVVRGAGVYVADCGPGPRPVTDAEVLIMRAHAQRIVACLTACDGIEDPATVLAEVRRILAAIALYADGAPAMEARRALSLLEPT